MWPFKRLKVVEHVTNDDVMRELLQLREQVEWLRAKHLSLQGRVYALWGKEPQEKPATPTNLNDPTLTKDQVRRALEAAGRLKPRTDN